MKYLYLLIDLFSVIVPFIFSFHPKIQFYKRWKSFFIANAIVATAFIVWDIYFTKIGVWGFNPDYLTGIQVFNLPLEEVLFFICIPYACIFTYHCLDKFYAEKLNTVQVPKVISALIIVLISTSIWNFEKAYTISTFFSLSILIILLRCSIKSIWLDKFLLVYIVLLIPFFIVNGILTGTGIESPIVWYNDAENLGIRLLTIPIEDIFYGLELVLLHVVIMTYLESKKNKAVISK